MKYDSIVIGSGFSGLSAAIVLQKNGHKVLVLERDKKPSPLVRRFKRNELWCDVGFHYAGGFKSSAMPAMFKYLGIWDRVTPLLMNTKAFDRIFYNGKVYEIPCGFENVRQAYLNYFPESATAVNAYMDYIIKTQDSTPFINFDLDFENYSLTACNSDISFHDFLKGHGAEDEFISIAGNHCYALCATEGREISMHYHALIMGAFYDSAYMFDRGGDEIADALSEVFMSQGGEIACNREVVQLEVAEGKSIKAVHTSDGGRVECDYCLFSAHPHLLCTMLPQGAVKPAFINRLKGHAGTDSFFIIWLDVFNMPDVFKATNNYVFSTDGREYIAVMASDERGDKRKALSVISTSPQQMPGIEQYAQRTVDPAYYNFKDKHTRYILKKVEELFPALTGNYRLLEAATPHTIERYTATPGGSAYGTKHTVYQSDLIPVTSVRALYLCGQSVQLPGLMGTMISAFISTSMIFGLENIRNQIRLYNE